VRRTVIALGLAATLAGTAHAVVWRADKTEADALALAAPIMFIGRVDRGGLAILIARDWALTAAHVAEPLTSANRIRWGDRDYAIKRVVLHPQGASDPARPRQPPEVDLALIQLAEPVDGVFPLMPNRATDELDQNLVIAGYGDFGPAGAPLTPADGRLRAVENTVTDAGPLRLFLHFDVAPFSLPLEGIGAAGDSGGPAFSRARGWSLFGVSSGADGPPGQYGTVDVYARVSSHIGWIESVAGAFHDIRIIQQANLRSVKIPRGSPVFGRVTLQGVVGVDGKVGDVTVLESNMPQRFEAEVKAALRRFRFEPRVEAGVPVARTVVQTFKLEPPTHSKSKPADDPYRVDDAMVIDLMRDLKPR